MGTAKHSSAHATKTTKAVRFTSAKQHKRAKAAASPYGKAKKQAAKQLRAGAKATGKTVRKTAHKALQQRATRRGRRTQAIAAVYTILIVISAATAAALASRHHYQNNSSSNDPFSASQQAAAGFTLYYPARLPNGYQIDHTSLATIQQQIVNVRLSNATGATITVTQQRVPSNFDLPTLYNSFGNRQILNAKLGTVTSGTIDNGHTHLSSLVTPDGTWVLMSSAEAVPQKDLQLIFDHLQAATATTAPAQ